MTRSMYKGPFFDAYILKKIRKVKNKHSIIKIYSRRSCILPDFVGFTFGVHNGKKFIPVKVIEQMVGHKFGEFSPTRTFHGHAGSKRKVVRK